MSQWVKVRSWHILQHPDTITTLCGLRVMEHPVNRHGKQANGYATELPGNERSCESCLRAHVKREVPMDETIGEGAL